MTQVVLAAVTENGMALAFASEELLTDLERVAWLEGKDTSLGHLGFP